MRDFIVISIVIVGAFMALRRPWVGVMLWTWISVMNPHRYCWGFAVTAPVAAVAAGFTLLGLSMTHERRNPFLAAPMGWLAAFAVWMTISWVLGYGMQSGDPLVWERDYDMWKRVMKTFLMIFVTVALLRNRHHILAFIAVAVLSLGILGAKGGIFTLLTGGNYRVWGPPGSFIYDNNEFALALIVTIPLLHFLQLQVNKRWMRHALGLGMLLCAAAALGSHSRGALLALGAMGAVMWWRSRRKGAITLAIIAVVAIVLPTMPDEWWERMGTISAYEEDASAMGRFRGWKVALAIALHHVTGAGMVYLHPVIFAMWDSEQGSVIAAHSIYFQILGNHGFIGLFLYLMMGVTTYNCARWLRRHARGIAEAQWAADLGSMVQVGMAGFAVGGALLSLAYVDLPFNMMVMVVLARHWVQTRGWESDPREDFLEYCGLRRRGRGRRRMTAGPDRARANPG
jgi:probable O-glycosylation ligase (exosortase A-associated)